MPINRNFTIHLELDSVLQAQGIKDYSRLRPVMKETINELLDQVSEGELLHPAVAYETLPIADITDDELTLSGNAAVLHGSLFQRLIPDAREIAAIVCTIGPELEQESARYFAEGKSLHGLLLDGIGSAAVGVLGSLACRHIERETHGRGFQAGSPISPGSPEFPVTEQRQLFQIAPAHEIGVTLSDSALMVPRKSLSMIIGIGHGMKTWAHSESCDHCTLSQTCAYRFHIWKENSTNGNKHLQRLKPGDHQR